MKSENIKEIAKALTLFQSIMPNVTKDAKNPFFKSSYATLSNIIETARPHMKTAGLSVSQIPFDGKLITIILHDSGEYLQGEMLIQPDKKDVQSLGSYLTYLRRYALSSMLGIATEDDDDGNGALKEQPKQKPEPIKPAADIEIMMHCADMMQNEGIEAARTFISKYSLTPAQSNELKEISIKYAK